MMNYKTALYALKHQQIDTLSLKALITDNTGPLQTLTGHSSIVSALTVLPNGRVVSGSTDNSLKVW